MVFKTDLSLFYHYHLPLFLFRLVVSFLSDNNTTLKYHSCYSLPLHLDLDTKGVKDYHKRKLGKINCIVNKNQQPKNGGC